MAEAIGNFESAKTKLEQFTLLKSKGKNTDRARCSDTEARRNCYETALEAYVTAEQRLLSTPTSTLSEFMQKVDVLLDGGVASEALLKLKDEANYHLKNRKVDR